jgi:hypothetical protein
MNWARILTFVTGVVDQELLARSEYLVAKNRKASKNFGIIRRLCPGTASYRSPRASLVN